MQITEEQTERICDYYCRFPKYKDFSQKELETICEKCPIKEVHEKCKD